MKFPTCLLLSATFLATPALAEPLKFKPIIDTRLRYETVDQEPIVKDADALTFRARVGAEMSNKMWGFLIEGEATAAIIERYNSGVNLKAQYPIVADPEWRYRLGTVAHATSITPLQVFVQRRSGFWRAGTFPYRSH